MADQTASTHARGHVHGTQCYWDYRECRWVCRPAAEAEAEREPVAAAAGAKAE
jgi:hypothetical protein